MNIVLAGLLGALLATNPPAAVSNLVKERAAPSVETPNPNDPVEKEYRQIMEEDDAAQEEVDRWIKEDEKFSEQGRNLGSATLRGRVLQRLEPIRKRYEDFLQRYPRHVRARIAFGSFLSDLGQEEEAGWQWEKATELDPRQPAAWNNLANYYGHNGEPKKAFQCYDKALEISPRELVYCQNLATTMYLFRKDAAAHYGLSEPQVFDRVMALYRKALALDPENFSLATELAQTYYGFKPALTNDAPAGRPALQAHYEAALTAWQAALKLAHDDTEREGVYVHLARVNILSGRLDEARRYLTLITNGMYTVVKDRLQKRIETRNTNAVNMP